MQARRSLMSGEKILKRWNCRQGEGRLRGRNVRVPLRRWACFFEGGCREGDGQSDEEETEDQEGVPDNTSKQMVRRLDVEGCVEAEVRRQGG